MSLHLEHKYMHHVQDKEETFIWVNLLQIKIYITQKHIYQLRTHDLMII